ncbi:MAG: methyltransferase [Deltaproteobacteria bacterium]|nr:methyltransferase [Candidatus Zymogenaceae bacterium]
MGGLVLEQPSDGYRYCLDPFLLADFVIPKDAERILDVGCGVGVIGLVIAWLWKNVSIVGVEIQRRLFDFARDNTEKNDLSDRVEMLHGDFREISRFISSGSITSIVSNPPFQPIGTGRISKNSEAAVARHEMCGGVGDFIEAATAVLGKGGGIFLVYPAHRWTRLSAQLEDAGFGPKRIRFVYPRPKAAAHLVLVEAEYRKEHELEMSTPLVIYNENGEYTKEVGKLFAKLSTHCY